MGEEKTKRQHYVPRFYLQSFSYDTEEPYYLYCYDKPEDKAFSSSIMNIAQSEYFYDLTDEQYLENKFAELEKIFLNVHRKLIDTTDVTSLTVEERNAMALFLSHQHIRTKKFRDIIKQASEHTLEIVNEDEVDDESARDAVEAGTTERGAKEWQAQLMSNALTGFADILNQMDWFLFDNKTEYPLWTSDHPIAIFNPVNPEPDPERGIERIGSKVHVPLSKDLVLALYDPRRYFVKSRREELTEEEHVYFQNKLQVEHSHRQVYSPEEDFELAREEIEENPEYANQNYTYRFPDESSYE